MKHKKWTGLLVVSTKSIDEKILTFGSELLKLKSFNKNVSKAIEIYSLFGNVIFKSKIRKLSKESLNELKDIFNWTKKQRESKQKESETLRIRNEQVSDFLFNIHSTIIDVEKYNNLIREMSLIYMISLFESYLENVLRILFIRRPEILKSKQKTVTFEEIACSKNLKELKLTLVEKEITSILCSNIDEIKDYIIRKFNINIGNFKTWKSVRESFYRRNIIVHNGGHVNKLYRMKTNYTGKEEKLSVSESYLNETIDSFNLFSRQLHAELKKKFRID